MDETNVRPIPSHPTRTRVLDGALTSFASRGYEATSLDQIAAAVGVRKQTILHHFGSKEALLHALLGRSAGELTAMIDTGLSRPGTGWMRVEAVVRSTFRLAGRRPELLGLVREVGRLGPPFVDRLSAAMDPLIARAAGFLQTEMERGTMRRHDPRLVLLSAYSTVIAAATEVEVLRSVGVEPTARLLVRRRRELLVELAAALRPRESVAGVRAAGARA